MNGPTPAGGEAMPRRSTPEYADAWDRCRKLGKELSQALADTGDNEFGFILPAGHECAVGFGMLQDDSKRLGEFPMQTINRLAQRIGLTLADDPQMPAERVTIDRSGVYIQVKTPGLPDLPVVDPLMEAITAFRSGLKDYSAMAWNAATDQECDAHAEATYAKPLEALEQWDEPARTREGAIEALRAALTDKDGVYGSEAVGPMIRAALAYLEGL